MPALLIATRNKNKAREITQMLGPLWTVRDLSALPNAPEIEETGARFQENAALKALAISKLTKDLVLADDSGLCARRVRHGRGKRGGAGRRDGADGAAA